jgi:hypothetical protein
MEAVSKYPRILPYLVWAALIGLSLITINCK